MMLVAQVLSSSMICSVNVLAFFGQMWHHTVSLDCQVPTMALNCLEVVHNYNYITRKKQKEKRAEHRKEEMKKTNMCAMCVHLCAPYSSASYSCAQNIEKESCGDFAVRSLIPKICSKKNRTRTPQTIFSYTATLCSHFVRYAIRNFLLLCSMLISYTVVCDYDGNRSIGKSIAWRFSFLFFCLSIRSFVRSTSDQM